MIFDWKLVVSVRACVCFPVRVSLTTHQNDYELGACALQEFDSNGVVSSA